MQATSRLRLAPEWDGRFTRMVVLSFLGHVSIVVLAIVLTARSGPRPLPMMAYTVEITDPSALGGRLPPGKISTKPTAEASVPAPAPGEPAAEPQPSVPEPPPAPPAPEPEPVAKVEPPKPEPPKADAVKIEPAKKPEPPKPPPKPAAKPEPKPTPPKPVAEKPKPAPDKPKAEKPADKPAEKPNPAAEKPADKPPQAAKPAGQGGPADADAAPKDAYAAAAERWRTKAQGQGLGGTDGGSGPIGTGGAGPGGGGQLVGVEFMAYRQQVITTVSGHWTNVVATPGLVAAVRFQIGADGSLGGIRLERSSGNAAYDSSALRAVQRTEQLPPPPAKYAKEFNEFVIEFHSEESGGKGSG